MGLPIREIDEPFASSNVPVAAVLCRMPAGNLHAGLAYFDRQKNASVLHLAWENKLERTWPDGGLWVCPPAEPEKLRVVASWCRRIWKAFKENRKMPYGLAYKGARFDSRGKLRRSPEARGLTCATFVLAVFESVGVSLVNEVDWPVRTDDDLEFLGLVEGIASSALIEALRDEVANGARRIRPDEVMGACTLRCIPGGFVETREAADVVVSILDRGTV